LRPTYKLIFDVVKVAALQMERFSQVMAFLSVLFATQAVKEHFGQNGCVIDVLLPKLQNAEAKLLYWSIQQLSNVSHKEVNLNVNLGATSKFSAPASIALSLSNYPSSFAKN
jgi:hypothetical protein